MEPTVASAIAKLVEIAYAKLGPTVPFMPAGQRRTERSEVSRCKVGTLKLVFLSIENKRSTIQFVIAEVAKRIQLNLEPTVASVIAKPVEIAYATLGPTVPF